MKSLALDRGNDNRIERDISPVMARAITLPVKIAGHQTPFSVYVMSTTFGPRPANEGKILLEIARRLRIGEEG